MRKASCHHLSPRQIMAIEQINLSLPIISTPGWHSKFHRHTLVGFKGDMLTLG